MLTTTITFFLYFFVNVSAFSFSNYNVQISNNNPIVKGGTITFVANVYEDNKISTGTHFKYSWRDNAVKSHTRNTDETNATDSWEVTYNADDYAVGDYIMNVILENCILGSICYEVDSARSSFNITETLNGKMLLSQENRTIDNDFVSNSTAVIHQIDVKGTDWNYIQNAPTVFTYWFVDCTYYGITSGLKFQFNYTRSEEEHTVEALIMADFTPISTTTVPPTTSTTTATTTTSTKATATIKPTTTSKPITTTTTKLTTTSKPIIITTTKSTTITTKSAITITVAPNSVTTEKHNAVTEVINSKMRKRNADVDGFLSYLNVPKILETKNLVNSTIEPYKLQFPYVCNGTQVTTDSKKTYGYFYRRIHVKAPISKVNVTGNNWIQHGNLLSLKVQCHGSRDIKYCVEYKIGAYNVTGNETCYQYITLDVCNFPINRYLSGSKYTVLIIIKNDVSKVVQPVTVTFYEVTTQPQLSVIVVPVAFSLVAVVLIVFGIAYYFQNRSRFVIEVADFNFGQQYSDLEYKTFRERLRDSITNAFTRGPSPSSSEVPVWPPGRKYGSMT